MEKCGPLADKTQFYLRGLFLAGNDVSLFELKHLQKVVLDRRVDLFVDGFERIYRNQDEVLFLSEVNLKTVNEEKIIAKLKSSIKNVIVKDIQMGQAQKNKKTKAGQRNTFMFIHFDHQNAIPQALKIDRSLIN